MSFCPLPVSCFPERYSQRERGHSEGQLAAQQVACDGTRRSGYADPLRVFVNPPSQPAQHRPRQQVGDSRRQHLCVLPGEEVRQTFIFLPFHRNEQYYEAIMSIWNQLYINIKSLISWQYCLKDINYISTLTVSMVSSQTQEPLCVIGFKLTRPVSTGSCLRCVLRSTAASSKDWRPTTKSSCATARAPRCLGKKTRRRSRATLIKLRTTTTR